MKTSIGLSVLSVLAPAHRALAVTNSTNSTSTTTTAYLSSGYLDLGIASDAYEKAKTFVASLNNTEKAAIVRASSFNSTSASWTSYANTGGVAGINFYMYVSGFPMGNANIMTWDRNLFTSQFKAVADEFVASGFNLLDGVVIGPLGRTPQSGRLNEAFSPDPFLSGIATADGVKAQTAAGAITGVRHFVMYEQETNRMGQSIVYSANADDKTLQELYMWPWGDAVNAGAMAVMCAMNKINDTYSCENAELLNEKLKTDLGFPGFVYPDASAQHTSYGSAINGVDYSSQAMQLWSADILTAGVANGSLPQERLDDMAIRSVMPWYFVGGDEYDLPEDKGFTGYRNVRGNHSTLIRKVGAESIALLKNDNSNGGGLPLNKPISISLYGAHAGPAMAGPNYGWTVQGTPADIFQGHLASGGGSGQLSLPYLVTPFQSITQHAIKDNSMIFWIMNNTYSDPTGGNTMGIGGGTGVTPSYANYAAQSEVCVVFLNSWSGEGADRSSLSDTDQDNLVTSVADNCNNTIVVLNTSGPRVLDAWIEHDNVTAVIYGGLLGQESGNAIADVLYGDVNPSGKLIHTIAKNESDYPASVCETADCSFDEGVYIDYRWFDKQDIEPRYPFGHGLSYTTFTYGDATATATNETALASTYPTGQLGLGGQVDLYDEVITVNTTITNSGSLAGAEVAQLYVSFPEAADQPVRILRGFEKVNITAGETANVGFSLRRRDVSYWDVAAQKWAIASGTYTFSVGSSSRDLRTNTTLVI